MGVGEQGGVRAEQECECVCVRPGRDTIPSLWSCHSTELGPKLGVAGQRRHPLFVCKFPTRDDDSLAVN